MSRTISEIAIEDIHGNVTDKLEFEFRNGDFFVPAKQPEGVYFSASDGDILVCKYQDGSTNRFVISNCSPLPSGRNAGTRFSAKRGAGAIYRVTVSATTLTNDAQPTTITNNFYSATGENSRVNLSSVDNSSNINTTIQELRADLDEIKERIADLELSPENRSAASKAIAEAEDNLDTAPQDPKLVSVIRDVLNLLIQMTS